MSDHPEANARWEDQLAEFSSNPVLTRNYLESMENQSSSSGTFSHDSVHWKFSKRFERDWKFLKHIQKIDGRHIFMSMFNGIDWAKKENYEECLSNSDKVKNYGKRFQHGQCSFLVQENKENTHTNLMDNGISLLMSCWKISKKADSRYSEVFVR